MSRYLRICGHNRCRSNYKEFSAWRYEQSPSLDLPKSKAVFQTKPHFFFIPIGKSTSLLRKMSVDSCVVHPDADIGCHPRCSNFTMTLCVPSADQVPVVLTETLLRRPGLTLAWLACTARDLGIQIPTVGGNDSGPRPKDSDQKMFHGHLPSSTTMFRARPT